MRKRTSIIWTISTEDLKNIVSNSNSTSDVLRKLGLSTKGGFNSKTIKLRLKLEKIDISHFVRYSFFNYKTRKNL